MGDQVQYFLMKLLFIITNNAAAAPRSFLNDGGHVYHFMTTRSSFPLWEELTGAFDSLLFVVNFKLSISAHIKAHACCSLVIIMPLFDGQQRRSMSYMWYHRVVISSWFLWARNEARLEYEILFKEDCHLPLVNYSSLAIYRLWLPMKLCGQSHHNWAFQSRLLGGQKTDIDDT